MPGTAKIARIGEGTGGMLARITLLMAMGLAWRPPYGSSAGFRGDYTYRRHTPADHLVPGLPPLLIYR